MELKPPKPENEDLDTKIDKDVKNPEEKHPVEKQKDLKTKSSPSEKNDQEKSTDNQKSPERSTIDPEKEEILKKIKSDQEDLPIFQYKKKILKTIYENDVRN